MARELGAEEEKDEVTERRRRNLRPVGLSNLYSSVKIILVSK